MAGSVNKVILVGNLGADPEVRRLKSGDPVVNLRIATSESWRDKSSGERREKVEWHNVVIFNSGLAKVAEQYLKKGAKVYIEGQLQTRKWQDQSGQDRYTTEVVLANFRGQMEMLSGFGDDQGGGQNRGQSNGENQNRGGYGDQSGGGARTPAARQTGRALDEDEIPFAPDRN